MRISIKGRKKSHSPVTGVIIVSPVVVIFRTFVPGRDFWHTSHVVQWGHISLYQLRYSPLNEVHTNLTQDLYYLKNDWT